MRILQKASRFLFKALEWFAIICMVVLTVIVFTDVILRYIFKQAFPAASITFPILFTLS